MNNSILRDKLKALLDLQSILSYHQLAPHDLEAVRHKVAELSAPPLPPSYPPTVITTPTPYSSVMDATQRIVSQDHMQLSVPAAPLAVQQHQPDISVFNSNRLADILASAKAQQAPQTPAVTSTPVPHTQPPLIPIPSSTSGSEPSSLLAQLRAAGILAPEGNTPVNGALAPPPTQFPAPQVPGYTPTIPPAKLAQPSRIAAQNDVELTSASLKK